MENEVFVVYLIMMRVVCPVEEHYLRYHRMQFVALKLCESVYADTVVRKQLVQWIICTHCKV